MSGCTVEACTVCGVRLDATPTAFTGNTLRDNWVAVMAYGNVSFDVADNLFENSGCCGLYLRDIGTSRFAGNRLLGGDGRSVQGVGTLGGSIWVYNEATLPADFSGAADAFCLMD